MEKLYWKGRKIKNNVVFHIKAFLHKRRDKLAVKKDDLSFERNVVKEVAKAFLKNVFIIAVILVVEQVIVSNVKYPEIYSVFKCKYYGEQQYSCGSVVCNYWYCGCISRFILRQHNVDVCRKICKCATENIAVI